MFKIGKSLCTTVASLSLFAASNLALQQASATAADPGSFYVKLSGGYVIDPGVKAKVIPDDLTATPKLDVSVDFSSINDKKLKGAVGYYASDEIRTEISASYYKLQKTLEDSTNLEIKAFEAMCTGYYDINSSGFFNPYIHAGVGLKQLKSKMLVGTGGVKDTDGVAIPAITGQIESKTDYKLAYGAGFGFNLNLTSMLVLGLDYTISNGQDQELKRYEEEKFSLKTKSSFEHTISTSVALVF